MTPPSVQHTRQWLRHAAAAIGPVLMAGIVQAQNLVLNPSFEDTVCSGSITALPVAYQAEHWYNPNYGTSDLFLMEEPLEGCAIGWMNNPAAGGLGTWQAPFDGEALAGIYCYHSIFCLREYLQVPLSEALEAGMKYCVSFRLSLRDNSSYALDRIGVHLSVDPALDMGGNCILGPLAQVQGEPGVMLSDTAGWMLLENDYIAAGGEAYLTIGNFIPDSGVNAALVNPDAIGQSAYYYIDDVVVERCEPSTGTVNAAGATGMRFDSATSRLFLSDPGPTGLLVFDAQGRLVHSQSLREAAVMVNLSFLPSGQYMAVVDGPDGLAILRVVALHSND